MNLLKNQQNLNRKKELSGGILILIQDNMKRKKILLVYSNSFDEKVAIDIKSGLYLELEERFPARAIPIKNN